MKSAVPLYALGAVVLLAAFSRKKPVASTTGTKTDGLVIPGKKVEPTPAPKPGGVVLAGGIQTQPVKCDVLTEYYDPKTKKCIKFWKEGETNIAVEKTIEEVLNEMKKQKKNVATICEDLDEMTPNPLAVELFKEVLYRIWDIPKDILPPNQDPMKGAIPPSWISMVWNRVIDIYLDKVCNIGFDPYA